MNTASVHASLVNETRSTFIRVSLLLVLVLPVAGFYAGQHYVSREAVRAEYTEAERDRIERETRIVLAQERTATALAEVAKTQERIERDLRDVQGKVTLINQELQGRERAR